jgi:hypothetical protein
MNSGRTKIPIIKFISRLLALVVRLEISVPKSKSPKNLFKSLLISNLLLKEVKINKTGKNKTDNQPRHAATQAKIFAISRNKAIILKLVMFERSLLYYN